MLIRIKKGKWGYYNTETGTIIDCQYDYVEDFVGEYAVVGLFSTETLDFGGSIATVDSSGRTIIDSSGNRFLQPIYDEIHIDDGFAIIQYRKHTGTFDLKKRVFVGLNKQELPRIFQAYDFAVEIAPGDVLTFTNGRVHWFHNEKEIVGDFSNVFPLNDSFYVFCHGWDRYGIMDKEAHPILEPTYHSINLIAPNLAAAKNKRGNFGLEHGDHYEIFDISESVPKKTCSVTGVISWIGGNVFSVFAASSQYFCADLYKGDVLFLGPNRPDTTIKLEFDFYGPYENGHIEIIKDNKHGILDSKGAVFIPCVYDEILFHDGYFIVKNRTSPRAGVINQKGVFTIPIRDYQDIELTNDSNIVLVKKGVLGREKALYTLSGTNVYRNSKGQYEIIVPKPAPVSPQSIAADEEPRMEVPKRDYGSLIKGPFYQDGHYYVYFGARSAPWDLLFLGHHDKVYRKEILRYLNINGDLPNKRDVDAEGRIIVSCQGKEVPLASEFTYAGNWFGNYMKVLSDDKWGIMNEELKLVIDCRFEFIYGIEDNAAIGLQFDDLSKRWLTFVIDLETCDCIKIPFDGCYGFKNGVAIVFKKKVSTVYGLINTKGETILPCEYQYIPFLDEDRLSAMLEIEKEREDVFGYSRKELDEMYLDALEGDPNNSSNIE